jgi:hypothetical protein
MQEAEETHFGTLQLPDGAPIVIVPVAHDIGRMDR